MYRTTAVTHRPLVTESAGVASFDPHNMQLNVNQFTGDYDKKVRKNILSLLGCEKSKSFPISYTLIKPHLIATPDFSVV